MKYALLVVVALSLCAMMAHAEDGAWKTVYVKRGFVGNYDAGWASGVGATLRLRLQMPCNGTKVRIFTAGCWDAVTELDKMTLTSAIDDGVKLTGAQYPILFAGKPGLKLEVGLKEVTSDEIDVPVKAGTWYLQDRYTSQKFPYAYNVDNEYCEAGDNFTKATLKDKVTGARLGITRRIDVFTTDKEPIVLCYGDSITHGAGATANIGATYPEMLGKQLKRPILNLGVNGDRIIQAGGVPSIVSDLKGIDTVVFLMGINDIIGDKQFNLERYVQCARQVIDGCRDKKMKVFIGTITPSKGYKDFDADPAKEIVRNEINSWIRTKSGADGVIDFDATLDDPAKPGTMKADCQSDWIHPNDKGYKEMANVAAKVIAATKVKAPTPEVIAPVK